MSTSQRGHKKLTIRYFNLTKISLRAIFGRILASCVDIPSPLFCRLPKQTRIIGLLSTFLTLQSTPLLVKLRLHDAIYRLRFYSNLLIHILSLSNSHNNVVSIQKNREDKSHRIIVVLSYDYTMRFIGYDSIQTH